MRGRRPHLACMSIPVALYKSHSSIAQRRQIMNRCVIKYEAVVSVPAFPKNSHKIPLLFQRRTTCGELHTISKAPKFTGQNFQSTPLDTQNANGKGALKYHMGIALLNETTDSTRHPKIRNPLSDIAPEWAKSLYRSLPK